MSSKIHFVTGLPRSGTTLLGALLKQNPRFEGGMSSPLGPILTRLVTAMSPGNNEFAVSLSDAQRKAMLLAMIEAYQSTLAARPDVLFDTNRLWSSKLPLISELLPDAKVIACVRDPAWVVDSFERLVRRNAMGVAKLFASEDDRATVFSRADALTRPKGVVGYALSATKEAYYSDEADRLLLVEYDYLAARPRETLQLIYNFLEEPWFEHDFENVSYEADEFDSQLNLKDLHRVSGRVEFKKRRTVLPPDLFNALSQQVFWRDLTGTRAKAIVVK
ncbi:sulfotransferase family protein [Palleronia caenipelagi]|uniref:Sulfotransferase n=1 Tax=Palleronia caenipelagi TaxID=2489174 RepID=A0A547PJS2_9RHOB|nr:sulfotransferase [Palleronia caenipelagi]TRD14379.1 sulfotransferase [Palleronia caenipelagi]